jgi:5-deoxy-glucuronate isomerase
VVRRDGRFVTEPAYRGAHVQLDLPCLAAGDQSRVSAPPQEEAALILLEGDVEFDGERVSRSSVFADRASAVYLPPGTSIDVKANAASELALATTVACNLVPLEGDAPVLVHSTDVVAQSRGRAGWQREVHDVIAGNVAARRLLVGETFNEPGQWSSFPPHKHDGGDGEPALEEVYYYRFDRPDGFGFQGLYEADGTERAEFLRHGAVVGIPRGYHPVCAAPGYRLYYLWALVGDERQLAMHEDPAHRWLNTADG